MSQDTIDIRSLSKNMQSIGVWANTLTNYSSREEVDMGNIYIDELNKSAEKFPEHEINKIIIKLKNYLDWSNGAIDQAFRNGLNESVAAENHKIKVYKHVMDALKRVSTPTRWWQFALN
jgi:hypothetical protein